MAEPRRDTGAIDRLALSCQAGPTPEPEVTRPLALREAETALVPGQRVFGRYTLEAEIGRGGMGVVWRARDEELGESIALKFLPTAVARDAATLDELKDETRRARRLTHANVVRIHDFVRDATMAAVSMELVDGQTLSHRRIAQPGKVFAVETLAPLVRQICAALDCAHTQAKIVHRDLKPANILVTEDGLVKVTDFGISRSLAETSTRLTGESAGANSGTLPYMSPQQLLGRKPTAADDIYALGATLYELLASKPPFHRGERVTLMLQIREERPLPLAEQRAELEVTGALIPPEWEATILACLAKEPDQRPASVREVLARLGLGGGDKTLILNPLAPNPVAASPAPSASHRRELGEGIPTEERVPNLRVSSVLQPSAPVVVPREFVVTVDPADVGAHLWLGPRSDLAVAADGRAVVNDLPAGEHELIVQAPGYQPFTTRVTVKDGRGSAEAKLVPVKGAVEIFARPGTVVAAVDARGRETGIGSVAPGGMLTADNLLTIGTYAFKFRHADCVEVRVEKVELALGRTVRLTPAQTALPGELRVFSVPTGAAVTVNGKELGLTPATLKVQPSETALAVEVFARGYRRSAQTVTLKPNETRTLNVGILAAESGGVTLRFKKADLRLDQVTITIDGRGAELQPARGAASADERRLKLGATATLAYEGLEVGAHTVAVAHPDYEPWTQGVTVYDQQETAVEVNLTPKPGRLALRTEPRDLRLTVNGRAVAPAEFRNGELALPAGEVVQLELSAEGYMSATRTVTLAPNSAQDLEIVLEKLCKPEAGQVWTIPDLNLTMMPIAAGTFSMGGDGQYDGKPQTRVALTKPFWLGKTEVTQREWTAVMGSNPSRFKGETLPVENVSWTDALAFCTKLTERECSAGRLPAGYAYTLPTEAQWEYACRAGTTTDHAEELDAVAWYDKNSGNTTHAVATKQANRWGLHDLHGNVWEWCADWYADQLPGGSVRNPVGATSGSSRVFRGGSWNFAAIFCRCAVRSRNEPDGRSNFLGFRLALSYVQ